MAIERSVRINIQTRDAQRNLQSLNRSFEDTDRNAAAASRATLALTGAVAGLVSAASVREIGRYADTYTGLQNQLRLVTDSSDELATANERLLEIAQATRGPLEGTVDLYARLSRSTDNLGVSSSRLFDVTEAVNQAIVISGSSATSTQAALIQLGQGLSAGALRGEELNSVMEQTPRLATAIADGLGVTIGQLRALGAEGQLTAERVFEALESQSEVLEREYAQTSSTISQAFTRINNELITYIGVADQSSGASARFTEALNVVADNFGDIADTAVDVAIPALIAMSAVFTGRLSAGIASFTAATVASTRAQLLAVPATVANTNATDAQSASYRRAIIATNAYGIATRAASGALAFVGGPVGVAVIAAGAIAALASTYETAQDRTQSYREETDRLNASLGSLSETQINRQIAETTAEITRLNEARNQLFAEAADLADVGILPENINVEFDGANVSLQELNDRITQLGTRNELARAQIDSMNQSLNQTQTVSRSVATNIGAVSEEFQTATFTIGRLTTNTEIAADRLLRLNEQLNPGQSEARQYSAFIQELTERLNPAGVALQSLREQVEFTNTAYNQGVLTYSQYREELDRLDAQILDVELAHTRNSQATDESSDSAQRATQSQSALSQALVVAGQSAEASSRQLDTATEATRRLVEETQRLSTTTSSISSTASFADLDSDSQAAFRARARGQLNQSAFGGTPSAAAIEQLATQLFIEATGGSRGRFANGGQFMVGGSGGTDSQRVTFDASPDERVTIETPSQQRQSRGVVVQSLTIQAQDRSIEEVFIELQQLQLQSGVMLDQTRGTIS